MTEIWHSHLDRIVKSRTRTPATPRGVGPGAVEAQEEQEEGLGRRCFKKNTLLSLLKLEQRLE